MRSPCWLTPCQVDNFWFSQWQQSCHCDKFSISLKVPHWTIDIIHKCYNAPDSHPSILHSEQKCVHFCSEWSIVGYRTGAFWDLWNWSIVLITIISSIIQQVKSLEYSWEKNNSMVTQKCVHFCSEWSIVGYRTGAFWDLWNWSIVLITIISSIIQQVKSLEYSWEKNNSMVTQKCVHFCSEWSIVGYRTGAFWDLWNWSIVLITIISSIIQQVKSLEYS